MAFEARAAVLILFSLIAWKSPLTVAGAGLMFGALGANAGQLLLQGYATDWIPVAGWLTNLADIAGGVGLLLCLAGYTLTAAERPVSP